MRGDLAKKSSPDLAWRSGFCFIFCASDRASYPVIAFTILVFLNVYYFSLCCTLYERIGVESLASQLHNPLYPWICDPS